MSKRYPVAKWTLPDVVNPPDTVCFTIEVPNNIYHIAAFRGALYNLTSARFWQDDLAHTALEVAAVWQDVFDNIRKCPDDIDTNQGITLEDFMSQQIRISPDDSCIIQMWCIDHWEDWYDPRTCVASTIEQPTNGSDLNAGECREWDVSLRASDRWLLPVAVNPGDTITVTDVSGAWSDGTIGWNCPNGFTYALGACISAEAGEGTDPVPALNHMRLIMNVDGAFTDAYNILYSTPPSVTDGQVYFQANDGTLEGNSGTIAFHVKVCRASNEPDSVTLTYYYGEGPTSFTLAPGEEKILGMNALLEPDGGSNNYGVGFFSNVELEYTLISATGFAVVCGGCVYELTWNAAHNAFTASLNSSTSTNPFDMAFPATGYGYQLGTGTGGAAFSLTLKVKLP